MSKQRAGLTFGREELKGWAAILLLVAVASLGLYRQRPPAAAPADSPPDRFAAGRALRHLEIIAAAPRPVGSPAHDVARDYLLGELRRLGLEAGVQQAVGISAGRGGSAAAGTVENVVGRLRGSEGGRAVLLAAHYDTVPGSFGASDNGAAVAALLEVARALRARPPLKRDVIFLFTDGEECGLLGAEAFAREHPWAKEVALVGNFEARGNGGPVHMFQTSGADARLVAQLGDATPHFLASSLLPELYRLLPNDTDFTVFEAAGWAGFNFAYFEGATHYHTRLDGLRQLDARSLQHHGQYALALARGFGDGDLDPAPGARAGDVRAVYFDVPGGKLIVYQEHWTTPLMAAVWALLAAVFLLGLKRRRMTWRRLALGGLGFVANAVVVTAVVSLAWGIVVRLDPESARAHAGDPYNAASYLVGLLLLACAVGSALNLLLARRLGFTNLLAGALLGWAVTMTSSALYLRGGSYLFIWPLFFVLIGLGLVFVGRGEGGRFTTGEVLILSVGAVPGVLLLGPLALTLYAGLGVSNIGVVVLPLVLLAGLLLPALDLLQRAVGWRLPAALAAAALALLLAGGFATRFDARHPEPESLFYVLDAGRERAIWLSFDERPERWASHFIPPGASDGEVNDYLPNFLGAFLNAPAPVLPLAQPTAALLSAEPGPGGRRLNLRIASPRGAAVITVCAEPDTRILSASVNGRSLAMTDEVGGRRSQGVWCLEYYAPEPEGFALSLEVAPSSPLRLKVFDTSYGLPLVPGRAVVPRPDDIMPTPHGAFYQETTIVTGSYTFAPAGG